MPSAFLSYSQDDLFLVEQLVTQLKNHSEITLWRDQEKIYGGQRWPKILGEAIADQDVFLLAWSKHSAASHFVEFEWTTAIALKKTVVPCRLDNTILPPSLAATHALPVTDLQKIVAALTDASPAADTGCRAEVVKKLNQITATEPEEVLKSMKISFDQRNWTVQGNVIQGENFTVHIGQQPRESAKGLAEKWQTWVAIVVGLLTAVGLAIELAKKLDPVPVHPTDTTKMIDQEKPKLQPVAGSIRDEDGNPLPNVQVSFPPFNLTKTTDHLGQFRFEVMASNQETIALLAQKQGYQPYEADVTLGDIDFSFTMKTRK